MNANPLYENLDTAFVNLTSLVRYLRRRKFVGRIVITYTGYDADICFTPAGKLRVTEHDHIFGEHTEGALAYKQIVEHAKETGGLINVYREDSDVPAAKTGPQAMVSTNGSSGLALAAAMPNSGNGQIAVHSAAGSIAALPEFPFLMASDVENKARQSRERAADFETLIKLLSELLATVDVALAKGGLSFSSAFAKACKEIADKYPFMDPANNEFEYSEGEVRVNVIQDTRDLVGGIGEALCCIFAKLNAAPRFGKVHRYAAHRLLALARERRGLYEKYDLDAQIKAVLAA